jgi:hypothetical protein
MPVEPGFRLPVAARTVLSGPYSSSLMERDRRTGATRPRECDGKPFNFAHLIFFSPTRGGLSAPVRAAQFLTRAQILLPNQALTASDPRLGLSALNG